jgi:DNA-binding HxlR family transcriptional regulator
MTRTYGQFCGIARAADILGERWALLIVRNLLVSPKRFGDLKDGLVGIPTNVLATRLRELEEADVVKRVFAPAPSRSVLYTLTPYGRDLDDIIVALGRWGARRMDEPKPNEIVTSDSLALTLRDSFHPTGRKRVGYELSVGSATAHALVDGGAIRVGVGPLRDADLRITVSSAIRAILAGRMSARMALRNGVVELDGPTRLFEEFVKTFRISQDQAKRDDDRHLTERLVG